MPNVFTNTPLSGDVWDMQGAVINFSGPNLTANAGGTAQAGPTQNIGTGGAPLIALGLQLSFTRGMSKRFPINVRRVIYLMGNPEGSISLSCLFGPNNPMNTFINTFSHMGSNAGTTNLASGTSTGATGITIIPFGRITYAGAGGATGNVGLGSWHINDPVITGIGLTIQEGGAQGSTQAIANVTMTFNNLDIS